MLHRRGIHLAGKQSPENDQSAVFLKKTLPDVDATNKEPAACSTGSRRCFMSHVGGNNVAVIGGLLEPDINYGLAVLLHPLS